MGIEMGIEMGGDGDAGAYVLSETSSRNFIKILAKPKRRYWGATVTAVTCPCHSRPLPSALPITVHGGDIASPEPH